MTIKFNSFIFFLLYILSALSISPISDCPRTESRGRELFVAMCDSRGGANGLISTKFWNITGAALRANGLNMTNVCYGFKDYSRYGLLTKPLLFNSYIKEFLLSRPKSELVHAIVMDSDTYWTVSDINDIWTVYDCVRGAKNIIVSSEPICWMGRYCNEDDIKKWFTNISYTPSYSTFVNSGVVMGRAVDLSEMFQYVISNNKSYYRDTGWKMKFDDQIGISDYSYAIAPEKVSIDYHQRLSGM